MQFFELGHFWLKFRQRLLGLDAFGIERIQNELDENGDKDNGDPHVRNEIINSNKQVEDGLIDEGVVEGKHSSVETPRWGV